eukprot:517408-Pleurochrysis_carterae.AAC.2
MVDVRWSSRDPSVSSLGWFAITKRLPFSGRPRPSFTCAPPPTRTFEAHTNRNSARVLPSTWGCSCLKSAMHTWRAYNYSTSHKSRCFRTGSQSWIDVKCMYEGIEQGKQKERKEKRRSDGDAGGRTVGSQRCISRAKKG